MTGQSNGQVLILGVWLIGALFLTTGVNSRAEGPVIRYQAVPDASPAKVLDVRPLRECLKASLPGARCLPVEDFMGAHRRLANISGILWLLGTAGLTGEERVLIVGDHGDRKEFLAGLLFLAGQYRVSILDAAVGKLPVEREMAPGSSRASVREVVFKAPMRARRLVLRGELQTQLHTRDAPVLLDGRSELEYWGKQIRATRGGHIPGAQHLPAAAVVPGASDTVALPVQTSDILPVAYGHDTYEGLIYLSRLTAAGLDARVLLDGWSGWAWDGSLPADSVTYPSQRHERLRQEAFGRTGEGISLPFAVILALLIGAGLTAGGMWIGRTAAEGRHN